MGGLAAEEGRLLPSRLEAKARKRWPASCPMMVRPVSPVEAREGMGAWGSSGYWVRGPKFRTAWRRLAEP